MFGGANSAVRTPGQTEIGLFWTDNTPPQYARAANALIQNYRLDLMDSARLLAMIWTAAADSLIGCFNAKYTYNFWRPVTAIPTSGGNSEFTTDPSWTPLATTPNHPEYPAAHGCITSAVSHAIENYSGTSKVHVVIDSLVFNDGTHTHTFEDTNDWLQEVLWARMFAELHFLRSVEAGAEIGEQVTNQLVRKTFRRRR
jgi:hypothetical protein